MNAQQYKTQVMAQCPLMLAVATRMLADRDDAADVVQDVLEALWKSRDTLAEGAALRAICFTATRNRCISLLRRRKFSADDNDAVLDIPSSGSADQQVACQDVRNAVDALAEPQRSVVRLSTRGFDSSEIARMLDLTPSNVRQMLSRSRKELRKILSR